MLLLSWSFMLLLTQKILLDRKKKLNFYEQPLVKNLFKIVINFFYLGIHFGNFTDTQKRLWGEFHPNPVPLSSRIQPKVNLKFLLVNLYETIDKLTHVILRMWTSPAKLPQKTHILESKNNIRFLWS